MRAGVGLLMLTACGRFGFASVGDAGADTNADAGADVLDAPPAFVCPTFATFCDSFETGDTSKWVQQVGPDATFTVEAATAHSGAHALDVVVAPTMVFNSGDVENAIATPAGITAVREWVYAPQPLTNFDCVMQMSMASTRYVIVCGSGPTWDVSESSPGAGLVDHESSLAPLTNTWTCLELDYTFAATPHIELFVNDSSIVSVTPSDTAPSYTTLGVGFPRTEFAGAHVIIDDVVLAPQHIGCN